MIRVGIVDFDTSHVVEFTKRLNRRGVAEDQWVDGATVVAGCPGTSRVSPERVPGFMEQLRRFGVAIVDKPADLLGKIDAVLIESNEGGVHLERARPFLEAGLPCFIDKPFACSADDARRIADLAARHKAAVFSSSALRYAPELAAFLAGRPTVHGVVAYGPASRHERNPGLYHYGIHAVEILYTLMGPGCERAGCASDAGADVATGRWRDGRLATVRGTRAGKAAYGATVFTETGPVHLTVGTAVVYRELLKRVVETFRTGRPALDPAVTVEVIAFIEAANRSAANHGTPQAV